MKERLIRLKRVLNRVSEIASGLNHPITTDIKDLLIRSSVMVPTSSSVEYVKKSLPFSILPLIEEDKINFPHLKGFFRVLEGKEGASASAFYNFEIKTIVIVFKRWQSDDYLASVLMHEATHVLQNSEAHSLDELSKSELGAYLVHFEIMDFIGEKNPRYKIAIKEEGLWALGLYKASNTYPGLNYDEAKRVRRFFDSSTREQDKAWYTLWWLRRNFEMFILLNDGDLVKASHDFRMFIKDVYSNNLV